MFCEVEWATGHSNSEGFLVLVAAADEDKLSQGSQKMWQEYLAEAPTTKDVPSFHVIQETTRLGCMA